MRRHARLAEISRPLKIRYNIDRILIVVYLWQHKKFSAKNQKNGAKPSSAIIFSRDYFEQHFDINRIAERSIVTASNNIAVIDTNGNT
jgi:hypothetical protein